jgi:lauroyl/myristoyl acyltransferase
VILEILRQGGAIGVLIDQNTLLDVGSVFVDLFGVPASTTAGCPGLCCGTKSKAAIACDSIPLCRWLERVKPNGT